MSTKQVELKVGESMRVGSTIITLLEKSGQRARLKVSASEKVRIEHPLPKVQSYASEGIGNTTNQNSYS